MRWKENGTQNLPKIVNKILSVNIIITITCTVVPDIYSIICINNNKLVDIYN